LKKLYATVVFPLALPKLYTYVIPEEMIDKLVVGSRVEVSLNRKLYAAIVVEIHLRVNADYVAKPIISILDEFPVVSETLLRFWEWIASYYCCTLGEVMHVGLPAGLKLSSETKVIINPGYEDDILSLPDDEYLIAEAVSIQNELSIDQIQKILNRKSIYPVIRNLLDAKVISIKEELIEKFKPKKINVVNLQEPYFSDLNQILTAFEKVSKSDLQTKALLAYIQLVRNKPKEIPVSDIYALANVDSTVLKAIEKKEIFTIFSKEVSRLNLEILDQIAPLNPLSAKQSEVLGQIKAYFNEKKPVLIHGVTGSGKTHVYLHLIKEMIDAGKQVLYLLPEIALTTQTVVKIQDFLQQKVLVYHSRMNSNERVEMWSAVLAGSKVILGARSSLFLPFVNLGLIIIDEEHDSSYKQNDPNPRYNARDAAVFMAKLCDAQVLLGSATPSLETFLNTETGKYGKVELADRFGESSMPQIHIVDIRQEIKDKRFDGLFSMPLRDAITKALEEKEQIILFQNRRGYSPTLHCKTCGWKAMCNHCDVHLTVHQYFSELRCHYCGFKTKKPKLCPACGCDTLIDEGFGTERIEEEIKQVFPNANVARLDLDMAKSKVNMETILHDFEEHKTDILVGTQMLTKGLDFGNVSVVGVLNADAILRYPDLRANERGYQLLTQVSGRSGRREKIGQVFIQTYQPSHPILLETLSHNYFTFYERETAERKKFMYPPFYRLVNIELLHKTPTKVDAAAQKLAAMLKEKLTNRVLGPAPGTIARIRGQYIFQIVVKCENDPKVMLYVKNCIMEAKVHLQQYLEYKSVRVVIDVDPY